MAAFGVFACCFIGVQEIAWMPRRVSCATPLNMGEFLGRWVCSGIFGVLCFAWGGLRASGGLGWVTLGLWLGFWNAGLRPVVLRFPVSADSVVWWLLLAISVLNMGVFWSVTALVPSVWAGDIQHPGWVVISLSLWSWALSCWFRAHNGHWHLVTYHGSLRSKR